MVRVKVIIVLDSSGAMTIDIEGPIKGKEGLLALLDSARTMAEQMRE
jgi:hypothetical protein